MAFPSDSARTKNWGSEVLTDSDLEAQLDLLHTYLKDALNSTTGHNHDGTSNQGPKLTTLGTVACTLPINFAKGADISSASTTDIGAATGNVVDVTGTTTITGLGTVQAGTTRFVRFTGILTLTHNGTSLILPTGADITTAAGDEAIFVSLGSGNWRCANYFRKDGTSLVGYNASTALSGSVIQTVKTAYGTYSSAGSTAMPIDNTTPQNTEGVALSGLDTSITPNNASNRLRITVKVNIATAGANAFGVALYQDSTASALKGTIVGISNDSSPVQAVLIHEMAAGTTISTTFKVRVGTNGGNAVHFNGNTSGSLFNSIMDSIMIIEEIKA